MYADVHTCCDAAHLRYSDGKGSCNAGVRSTIPAGLPNAGQKCEGGGSPCGFHLHEGAWEPCKGNSTEPHVSAAHAPRRATRGVGAGDPAGNRDRDPARVHAAVGGDARSMPCEPDSGLPSSVSFAVTTKTAGEWTENFTAPIVGPNLCPGTSLHPLHPVLTLCYYEPRRNGTADARSATTLFRLPSRTLIPSTV